MNKIVAAGAFLLAAVGSAIPSAHATLNPAHFQPWTMIPGGTLTSAPAILTKTADWKEVYARGASGNYFESTFWSGSNSWTSWALAGPTGGSFVTAPSCANWPYTQADPFNASGRIIVGVDGNDAIWISVREAGTSTLHDWHKLPVKTSIATLTQAQVAFAYNRIYITKTNGNGQVNLFSNDVTYGYSATNWHGPYTISSAMTMNNTAAIFANPGANFLNLVVLGSNSKFQEATGSIVGNPSNPFDDGFSSAPWLQVAGGTYLNAAATIGAGVSGWGPGHMDVFGIGMDGKLWAETAENGAWSTSSIALGAPAGITLASHPAAVSSGVGHTDIVVRGSDSHIYARIYQD